MMLKFRVWDIENKEMLDLEELNFEVGEPAVRTTKYSDYFGTDDMILMQYTGLKDKNRKDIYIYEPKASKKDRDGGLEEFGSEKASHKNTHPCVKPCELMQYLVRLVSPKGAIILDPFMGSGSTGKAVAYENKERNADYKFIGIEMEKEYCKIAEARIKYVLDKE